MSARVWALGVEYDGSRFHGWQRQSGVPTVQAALEAAIGRIAAERVALAAAGRTDAGVHATGQVVSFQSRAERSADNWVRGAGSLLAPGIGVTWALPMEEGFHARFAATSRRYFYIWLEAGRPPVIGREQVAWTRHPFDDAAMHAAAQELVGEHDFSSFRAASCQSRSPYRCIFSIAVRRCGDYVVLDALANAFLHHMVRNLASALAEIGTGARQRAWLRDLLGARDRTRAPKTAAPQGLYFVEARYGALELPRPAVPVPLRALPDIW